MEENNRLGLLLGLGLGILVGAGTAILLAPATGKETREFLSKKTFDPIRSKLTGLREELRVNIADFVDDVKTKGAEVGQDAQQKGSELWQKGKVLAKQTLNETN